MAHIRVKKGLNIPLKGKPEGELKTLGPSSLVGLDLSPFNYLRLHSLFKVGKRVKKGEVLVQEKKAPFRTFLSPASGTIQEIVRGFKHSLKTIIIKREDEEAPLNLPDSFSSKEELIQALLKNGLFPFVRKRPFHVLPSLSAPRSIFVQAVESAPFVPSAELQILGEEENFAYGLQLLSQACDGNIHLVFSSKTDCNEFKNAKNVSLHTVSGVHPKANPSVHIQTIDPIRSVEDCIWTVNVIGVITIGKLFREKKYYTNRVISFAGPAIPEEKRGFFLSHMGFNLSSYLTIDENENRLISGDPLTGSEIRINEFLGFSHTCFCAFNQEKKRKFMHFFRLGRNQYSASHAYLSGYSLFQKKEYDFSTSLHGEVRPFIDESIYDRVMPLKIPTAFLIKALITEDFEKAEKLGLLEVAPEDFALPTFVCPSKIEMVDIVESKLRKYGKDILSLF